MFPQEGRAALASFGYIHVVKIHFTFNHLKQWYIEHFIFYLDHFGLLIMFSSLVPLMFLHLTANPSRKTSKSLLNLSSLPVTAPKGRGMLWKTTKPSCLIHWHKRTWVLVPQEPSDNSSVGSRHPLCPITQFCYTPQLPPWLFLPLWCA